MRQGTIWLSSFGAGAATAWLFDPAAGKRRRHRIADAFAHVGHRTVKGTSTLGRDLGNRTQGVVARARRRFSWNNPDDEVLEERVHSALGRIVSHPHAITVRVCAGHVTLDGPIPRSEEHRIVHAVGAIPGVSGVETSFNPHIQPAHPSYSEAIRPGAHMAPRPDILQRNWAPSTRAIAAGTGVAMIGAAAVRRDRTSIGLAGAGAALITRAATNLPLTGLVGVGAGRRTNEDRKAISRGSAA